MKIAELGKNYTIIDNNIVENGTWGLPALGELKFHLIKLDFDDPTEDMVESVFENYPETKRFIVNRYIKFYNNIFKKQRNKKFYVENKSDDNILIFFKKNNKIAVNLNNMRNIELQLFTEQMMLVLSHVEVLIANSKAWKRLFEMKGEEIAQEILSNWRGNVVFEEIVDAKFEIE